MRSTGLHSIQVKSGQKSTSFTPGMRRKLEQVQEEMPSAYKTFCDAFSHKSRAKSVKAFCIECNGFDRVAVKDCSCDGCPLWSFRPYAQREVSNDNRD